ncbi:MAG: alkaline phosphatase family protein [Thermoplasmata archaeon]
MTPGFELRYALVILDGLGDRPHPETGDRSPVEAAATPNLDRLAQQGQMGQVVVVGPGVAPESDAGVYALLGYNPVDDSPGRGVLEAEGLRLGMAPNDVAFRMNFATIDGERRVLDSRVGRSLTTSESEALARALTDARLLDDHRIEVHVAASVGHRGVVVLHALDPDRPLSPHLSNTDPFYERTGGLGAAKRPEDPRILPVVGLDGTPGAQRTAEAVNVWVTRALDLLAGHPVNARRALSGRKIANGLLLRNSGAPGAQLPVTFEAKYGLRGGALTEMPVERGIARRLGLTDRFVGPMGPDREAGYAARARAARELIEETPFVYVHLKGPDEPGHDGRARQKQEIIEAIDRFFFGPFLAGLDPTRIRLAVTADHATPAILKGHSDDPVPLLLWGAGVAPGPVSVPPPKFGEGSASRGSLGTLRGAQVLPLLLDLGPSRTP